eukprot:COSAG04_NODE_14634_length_561_cov_0.487013_1_plen_32_part_10
MPIMQPAQNLLGWVSGARSWPCPPLTLPGMWR